jgi:Ciliary BBSome complex subunit 2, middle region/Ciliary BBSome complex subunit 2, N-terminal
LTPRFQLHLGERAHPGRAALGTFDCDSGPCLALTGAGNRVSLHPLHEPPGSAAGSARVLAAAGPVTALAAGPLLPGITTDILFIGTATSLHAYDVSRNRDVFFIDVPDGVTCLAVVAPSPPGGGPALVLAGGTCALAGFDASGKEVLWAAAGGRVLCVAAADAARGGGPAILAGCDDADIRGYDRGGSLLFTLPEADAVVALAGLHGGAFAYALANGTVGVYRRGARAWRVKSKHAAAGGLVALDLGFGPRTAGSSGGSSGGGNDCDVGCVQLVAGWASGRVEVRDAGSGDVLARDHMAQRRGGIVALFATASLHCMNSNTAGPFAAGDGCSKGSDATSSKGECGLELLTLGGDGELRGYGAARPEMAADGVAAHCPLGRAVSGPSPELCAAQAMITELARKRAEALRELTELSPPLKGGGGGAFAATGAKGGASNSSRRLIGAAAGAFAGLAAAVGASAGNNAAAAAAGAGGAAAIPPQQAPVEGSVTIDRATLSCQLTLTATSADAVIRAAVVFGEQACTHAAEQRVCCYTPPTQTTSSFARGGLSLTPRRRTASPPPLPTLNPKITFTPHDPRLVQQPTTTCQQPALSHLD